MPRPSEICEDSNVENRYPPKIEPAACSGGKTIEMRRRRRENNKIVEKGMKKEKIEEGNVV